MANKPVAPFYVPRPAEEQLWNKLPVRSPIIPQLTEQKFFGAGGQVPAKRWNAIYTDNVAESFWNSAPLNSIMLDYLIKQKIYAAGGQVAAKQWGPIYNYNTGESFWNSTPLDSSFIPVVNLSDYASFYIPRPAEEQLWSTQSSSSIIAQLTHGPSALLRTSQLNYSMKSQVDDLIWYSQPIDVPQILSAVPFVSHQYNPRFDDITIWYGKSNDIPQTLSSIPFIANQPNPRFDDLIVWYGKSIDIPQTLSAVPFIVNQSNPRFDDLTLWYSQSIDVPKTLSTTTKTPFFADQPNFNSDDSRIWQGSPVSSNMSLPTSPNLEYISQLNGNNFVDYSVEWFGRPRWNIILNSVIVTISPFITVRQSFNHFDHPIWSQSLDGRAAISMLTVSGIVSAKFWRYDSDDASNWLQRINKNQAAIAQTVRPFENSIWNNYLDASVWYSSVNRNLTSSIVQPTAKPFENAVWNNYFDASVWHSWINRNLIVNTPQVARPFLSVSWKYNLEDQAAWLPRQSNNIIFAPPVVQVPFSIGSRWNFVADDSSVWKPAQRNNSMSIVSANSSTQSKWNFSIDDLQAWSYTQHFNSALLSIPFFNSVRNSSLDDRPTWQWASQNITITTPQFKPFVDVFWKHNYDDAVIWQSTRKWNNPLFIPLFSAKSLRNSNLGWNFASDDASVWRWRPRNNRMLPHHFKISRVAYTMAENRVAIVPVEKRSVNTSLEKRSIIPPKEDT